ncbi:unnamed protein product [Prunus armeniaca]|uniref:Ku70/Ku80 N-terminal alpha/beta domain-containing protein n=1 Tax=Prunus armeniaca TaxID=36596 RepID=A0A6J5U1A1_PRUAR|nr:unnamed protein product [Prunus armeniaca]
MARNKDAMVLLIDVSPSMHKALPEIEKFALCSRGRSKYDEVAVVLFGTEVQQPSNFMIVYFFWSAPFCITYFHSYSFGFKMLKKSRVAIFLRDKPSGSNEGHADISDEPNSSDILLLLRLRKLGMLLLSQI